LERIRQQVDVVYDQVVDKLPGGKRKAVKAGMRKIGSA
jgi:hypothetical protein